MTEQKWGPSLDTDVEPWVARMPGLGTVLVAADGGLEVRLEEDLPLPGGELRVDSDEQKEAALRHGWGEPLSLARRGFRLAGGAGVVAPGDGPCLILAGDPHDAAAVLLALAHRGWRILADRVTPVEWVGDLLFAHPRQAPILAAKRRLAKSGDSGERVRADSDSRSVDLARESAAQPVAGIVVLQQRKPDEEVLMPLAGHERFESAANLLVGGLLGAARQRADAVGNEGAGQPGEGDAADGDRDAAADALAEHLRLAALPMARLRLDSATWDDDVTGLVRWSESLGARPAGTAPGQPGAPPR